MARELSIDEIAAIHRAVPDMPLEVFTILELYVSVIRDCAMHPSIVSEAECQQRVDVQFCRMKFSLTDSDGKEIEHDRGSSAVTER